MKIIGGRTREDVKNRPNGPRGLIDMCTPAPLSQVLTCTERGLAVKVTSVDGDTIDYGIKADETTS